MATVDRIPRQLAERRGLNRATKTLLDKAAENLAALRVLSEKMRQLSRPASDGSSKNSKDPHNA
jgi:hypothetical protein